MTITLTRACHCGTQLPDQYGNQDRCWYCKALDERREREPVEKPLRRTRPVR